MSADKIIKTEWWDGVVDWDIEFNDTKHIYKVAEKGETLRRVPSVTTILGALDFGKSGAMTGWAARLAADTAAQVLAPYENKPVPSTVIPGLCELMRKAPMQKRDKAGEAGTVAHDWAEKYARALMDGTRLPALPKDKQAARLAERIRSFFEREVAEPLLVEAIMASRVGGRPYAGTVDLLYRSKRQGQMVMLDFKTSNHPDFKHLLQMYGYDWCQPPENAADAFCVLYVDLKLTARCPHTEGYWEKWQSAEDMNVDMWKSTMDLYTTGSAMKKAYAKKGAA